MTLDVSWDAPTGLVPAVVQDWRSGEVLMLGYMNAESLVATETSETSGRVTSSAEANRGCGSRAKRPGIF